MDANRRETTTGPRRRPVAAPAKADEPKPQEWQENDRQARFERMVERFASILGRTKQEVIELGRADQEELKRQLVAAGWDPVTGRVRIRRFKEGKPIATGTAFDIRRTTTDAVTLRASDLRPAEDPLERLQEAVEALPDASRDRADELGHQFDEEAKADAQLVMKAIEKKVAAGAA